MKALSCTLTFGHRLTSLSVTNGRSLLFVAALAGFLSAGSGIAKAAGSEVVFRTGGGGLIDWFVIDDPSIHGSLNITNPPSSGPFNAAAVDLNRNRLVFITAGGGGNPQGYAVNLAGLQLVANGAANVSVTALGAWPDPSPDLGYRKADGQLYYHPQGSDQFRRVNFDANGLISGATTIGKFNGGSNPNNITAGDIDFGSDGSIWMTGDDDNNNPALWHFDFSTLNAISTLSTSSLYRGMTFDAAGATLYGYTGSGNYGIINQATGAFQTILDSDATLFGGTGDLATGTANIAIVPEPASLSLMAIALPLLLRRRRASHHGYE